MKTNAEIFAERGDPWDSRIPKHWGRMRAPRDVHRRTDPDGFEHRTLADPEDYTWVDCGPVERPKRVPDPKPNPAAKERNRQARLLANKLIRFHKGVK